MSTNAATAVIGVGLAIAVVAGLIALSRAAHRQARELSEFAALSGWTAPADPLPPTLAPVAASARSRMMLYSHRNGCHVWLSWHRWTETSTGNPSRRASSTTHDLTRYFVTLPRRRPNVAVQRRTGLAGLLKPVRGAGTGDPPFDRAFLVKPADEPVALALVTAPMRDALRRGLVPPWQIVDDLLVTGYSRPPTVENLNAHADAAVHAVRLLPD